MKIRTISIGLLLLLGVWPVCAATDLVANAHSPARVPTNRPMDKATVFSNTRQFAVSGCPAAPGLQIALWADDVQARLGRFVGIPIAPPAPLPLVIRVLEDASIERGRVVRYQSIESGMVDQRIEMINPAKADQEDLLEGVCSLLLSRTAYMRAGAPASGLPRIPDWFAVGVAQNLFPEARARNRAAVIASWRTKGPRPMGEILAWDRLPDGRWEEKPEAALFVEWLLQPAKAPPRAGALLDAIAGGQLLSAETVSTNLLRMADLAEAERVRDLWMAQQQQVQSDPGTISVDRVAELVRMLEIHPSDYAIPSSDKVPVVTDLRDMIQKRAEPWVRQLAGHVSTKAKLLSVGQPPDFQRVVEGYIAVLDGLAKRSGGFFGGGKSPESLRLLLDEAETRLVAFQQMEKDREKIRARAVELPATSTDVPASAGSDPIKAYLDEIERRLTRP